MHPEKIFHVYAFNSHFEVVGRKALNEKLTQIFNNHDYTFKYFKQIVRVIDENFNIVNFEKVKRIRVTINENN